MEEILIVVFLLAIYLLHLGLHAFNLLNVLDDEEADLACLHLHECHAVFFFFLAKQMLMHAHS